MTREEAINVLKEYRTMVMNCLEAETPAFDMAIESLSAECPQNDTQIGTSDKCDLISRAEANKKIIKRLQDWVCYSKEDYRRGLYECQDIINDLPSVSADSDDLIIKNGKGIQDGLYNIKDGEIFKYKAKGGTVRAYKLVECVSAECVGEWIFKTNIICGNGREGAGYVCSVCGVDFFHVDGMKYCPNCGAKMKGE